MEFGELIMNRRSKRIYTDEPLPEFSLDIILNAGLLAPTGRNLRPAEIIVVRDRVMLDHLAEAKTAGSAMLKNAKAALVVVGDAEKSDTWIEDCSIMMSYMQLAAENFGVGNCWIQIRGRESQKVVDGVRQSSAEYVREALSIPANYQPLAMLSVGMSDEVRPRHSIEEVDPAMVHEEKF